MALVFLSYSHVDTEIANCICGVLDDVKVSYFRDKKNIDLGQDIEHEVCVALLNCAAVVVVVSPASLESAWVPYELGHARALQKDIVPYVVHRSLRLPSYLSRRKVAFDIDQLRRYFADYGVAAESVATARLLQRPISNLADNNGDAIVGTWRGSGTQERGPDGHPIAFSIEIVLQSAIAEITGEMHLKFEIKGKPISQSFDVSGGFVRGRFGWLNYVARAFEGPHFGSIVLDLLSKPDRLVAHYTGYGAWTDAIVSGFATLTKAK